MENKMPHVPVLLEEVIENLKLEDNGIYFDCTFGAGGYSSRILAEKNCRLFAIDQDPSTIEFTKNFPTERFTYINDNFANLAEIAARFNLTNINGIVFDLGVSSMQLDEAERGFSFNKNARLDMRMSKEGIDAWEVVNNFSETDLADIIYYYGEETFARVIAKKIVQTRQEAPINTTLELAAIIQSVIRRKGKIDPATKTFQALRVYVNDELKVLKKALTEAFKLLKLNGRMLLVSFQGLEDRIIKDFVKNNKAAKEKIYKTSLAEQQKNPRSRSAKLRVIERVA